jgi:phage regulator Rha-like protein
MSDNLKSQSVTSKTPFRAEDISRRIFNIRGHRVMLDADLAELYDVPTKRLNEAIKRNAVRFPEDFMFQLSHEEVDSLRSQNATLETGRGKHRKYSPFAFTERGVAMLSGVLHSPRAVQVNIAIMRAFVRMRKMLLSHEELARKVNALEGKYDAQFRVVFDAIRALMEPPKPPRGRIGF